MKGQLSAEMLILIAVIVAIVAIAATRLITTAEESSEAIDVQSNKTLQMAQEAVKGKAGDFCVDSDGCEGTCDEQNNVCE